ncbi:MAG: VWA domain-containing protein [Pseudomonadota bacterium]
MQFTPIVWALALSASVLFTTAPAPAQQIAEGREQAILVLDASGSMWGQIDGISKIEIAREQIAGMLESWDPAIDLGLIAYGHRERGACDDIEVVLPAAPVESGAFSAAVNGILPQGKTPLSASVRRAAEAMRYTEERATVILLSDGLENCAADPCALADELEKDGIDFTAHVIGFDLSETDAAELSCLAERTGGEFFLAGTADSLTQSLARTVETIAEAAPAPEPASAPEPEPEVLTPEPEPAGPIGLRARAKLCEDCEVLTDDVFWRLHAPEPDISGKREELARRSQAQALFEAQIPGDYYLTATVGEAVAGMPVTVEADTLTDVELVVNAGLLRARAEASPGGTQLEDNLFYTVLERQADLSGKRQQIAASSRAMPVLHLPAGDYLLRVKHGSAVTEVETEVVAGEVTDLVIAMNVGYLRLSAIPTAGADPLTDKMFYQVFEATKDLQGKRKSVTASSSASPLFRLDAGDYVVTAKHGEALSTIDVSVAADALSEKVIDMNLGYLRADAVMAEGLPPLTDKLFYQVFEAKTDLQGKRKQAGASSQANPLFRLPAGDYRVTVKHLNTVSEADITVTAGALEELTIVQNSGVVRASAVLQEGGEPLTSGIFWTLLSGKEDLSGKRKQLGATAQSPGVLSAKAGSVVLRARHEGQEYDFALSLNPGEVKDVTVLLSR